MPVVLITAEAGGVRTTATGTLMYVALEPAMVAVSMHVGSRTGRLVQATSRFSASVLADGDHDLARRAGQSTLAVDAYASLGIEPLAAEGTDSGLPVGFAGALAVLWCVVETRLPVGNHVLYAARVEEFLYEPDGRRPLVRHERRYVALGRALTDDRIDRYPI